MDTLQARELHARLDRLQQAIDALLQTKDNTENIVWDEVEHVYLYENDQLNGDELQESDSDASEETEEDPLGELPPLNTTPQKKKRLGRKRTPDE